MCGILVVWSKQQRVDEEACRRALHTMASRGPDFCVSRVWDRQLFLSQAVLSLSGEPGQADGYQRSRSGRWEVLYNGELYNCEELERDMLGRRPDLASRSGSDTELLANLHEVMPSADVPERLDGMFAYAVFDEQSRRLSVARDPQGEKLVYLFEDDQQLIVASEIRAILSLVPHLKPDPQPLRDYFRTRHLMLGGRTVYPGIRELPAGAFDTLELESGRWTQRRFGSLRGWLDPARMEAQRARSVDSLADELDALIDRCVQEMLPRDRRYAAVVSGGVDSSLIAAAVVKQGDPDMLIGVDSIGKDPLTHDLSGFEHALSRSVTTLRADAAMYALGVTPCQVACGSPLPSHSFVAQSQQSAAVQAAGCRVLFGGEGADELFGGYQAYLDCGDPSPMYSPSPYTAHRDPLVRFLHDDREAVQSELASAWLAAQEAYAFVDSVCERRRQAMMFCDAEYQLPKVGLRSADVMSMMWSVESRSVFVRKPIVQFALNLPAHMKADVRPGVDPVLRAKPILKKLFLRRFPEALLQGKQGFAGFPNESGVRLGPPADFVAVDYLGIDRNSLGALFADRDEAWKLINVEYFLRHAS
jgi:asparagine synthase (glutamine-hydrolysing)